MSTSQIVSTSEQIDLKLEGMTCSACVAAIERSLNGLEGISATVNFATESAHILAPKGYKASALIDVVKKTGYGATLLADETESFSRSRRMGWRVFFAAILPQFVDRSQGQVILQMIFLAMIFFVIAFTVMYIFKFEPKGDGGIASFFLFNIILYWAIYIIAFNYTLFKTSKKFKYS